MIDYNFRLLVIYKEAAQMKNKQKPRLVKSASHDHEWQRLPEPGPNFP